MRAEIFFDPQGHTVRGIPWKNFMLGFTRARAEAQDLWGISSDLILSFLRHLPEADALKTFAAAMDYRAMFIGIGLDSSELGYPPHLFKRVFREAADAGLYLCAHAGEEGPVEYIWQALDILGVQRIDHGNNASQDSALVQRLVRDKIPLTMCPLSNQRLCNVLDLSQHQLRSMLDKGVVVTINSDDPAYFGGYINDNYQVLARELQLNAAEIRILAQNSLAASFTAIN